LEFFSNVGGLLGVKISNHFQKIKKAYDHVVKLGYSNVFAAFWLIFFRVASVLGVFFQKIQSEMFSNVGSY